MNLTAAAVLTALVLPALVEAGPSALVYLGSGAGRRPIRTTPHTWAASTG
ncbi:MAG: hypothetical protein M3P85_01175 [Actinomycetota bacterium]|nr:hypothetical protein [Actinomycetota bacterium]